MNVFISWSGSRSRAVAEALHKWLPKVVNAIKPWLSSADMEKGVRWSADVALRLEAANAGIICLTPTNLHSDWILFEAGALSKTVENAFVCPFLIGVEPSDLKPPLSQFQCTRAEKEDVLKLLTTLNSALEGDALPETHIQEVFEVWWPKLDSQLKMLPSEEATRKQHRTDRELLEEILSLVRDQSRSSNLSLQSTMSAVEQEKIMGALEGTQGNLTQAAQLLSFSRQTLLNKMDRYGIPRNYGRVETKSDDPSTMRASE